MSVIKIELQNKRAELLFGAVEKLAEAKQLAAPALSVELEAGAVTEQLAYVKRLLIEIAADDTISEKAKKELSDFLAGLSLSLKRALQGSFRASGLTAASVHRGHAMKTLSAIASKARKPDLSKIELEEN
jgi:hypothetical protein